MSSASKQSEGVSAEPVGFTALHPFAMLSHARCFEWSDVMVKSDIGSLENLERALDNPESVDGLRLQQVLDVHGLQLPQTDVIPTHLFVSIAALSEAIHCPRMVCRDQLGQTHIRSSKELLADSFPDENTPSFVAIDLRFIEIRLLAGQSRSLITLKRANAMIENVVEQLFCGFWNKPNVTSA